MKWEKSVIWMFLASVVVGYFITSNLLVNSIHDVRSSYTKFYMALYMALWMVVVELVMFPQAPLWMWIISFILVVIIAHMARKQILVDDKQYLKAMIQHHSSAILTSDRILEVSQDSDVRKLASWISRSQQEEIHLMNRMLQEHEENGQNYGK